MKVKEGKVALGLSSQWLSPESRILFYRNHRSPITVADRASFNRNAVFSFHSSSWASTEKRVVIFGRLSQLSTVQSGRGDDT